MWHTISLLLINHGGGQSHCSTVRRSPSFPLQGANSQQMRITFWGNDLRQKRRAAAAPLFERGRDKTAIRFTREMRRQGEGGGIWSPKYLHCCCLQYWESLRRRSCLKALTLEGKIHGVIKRGEPFEGISWELIHVFLQRGAFGEELLIKLLTRVQQDWKYFSFKKSQEMVP